MKELILTLAIAITLIGTACSGDPVIGLWETTTFHEVINQPGEWDGRARMRFEAGGEYTGGFVTSGKWSRLNENQIRLDLTTITHRGNKTSQKILTIKIEGDTLTTTDEERMVTLWRRVR